MSSTLVKLAATKAGFDLCGVARAVPGDEDARLQAWLANGYHGDMAYMERRKDVRELLPGCQSVIALAVNYHTGHEHSHQHGAAHDHNAKVSRYAWGEDYHRIVGRRLETLTAGLESLLPGETHRAYCDTGPLMEKAWAERAGIGWIGKNGCLISQEYGSWIFLSVVLTTAELVPDTPHVDRCGTCEICLHSCPTDAFVAPKVIDARRCIPYLTIEQWKPIPNELKIAPWAFGCDVCQEVCPWNSRAVEPALSEFKHRAGQDSPDLKNWIAMRGPEFRETYSDTPLLRPGRRGLARNALAVMRETGIDAKTAELARNDASALVRDQLDQ